MEATTLSEITGIRTTSGRISGTKYPALRSSRIKSSNGKALSGSWTHVRRAMANDKLYCDRVKAIVEWFDVWDSSQRCKFFLTFLRKCTKTELAFVEGWFFQRSPILRQDFTSVLPRWISLYIFSFLDPRSLCQAAQVSWHWHFVAEQDAVWMPKCIRLGWMLPVFPSVKEYGTWKYHYIKCVKSSDFNVSAYHVRRLARWKNIQKEGHIIAHNEIDDDNFDDVELNEGDVVDFTDSNIIHEASRPPWKISTKSPRILERDHVGMLSSTPRIDTNVDGNNNNNASRTSKHHRSKSVPAALTNSLKSRSGSPLSARESAVGLSKSLSRELPLKNRSYQELSEMSFKHKNLDNYTIDHRKLKSSSGSLFHTRRSLESKSFQTTDEPIVRHDFAYDPPVVLYISSEMPAKEILLDCARFGTITIPYEFKGTTLDSLVLHLKLRLAGRQAKSIGFCVDGDKSQATARIIEGATLSISTLKHQKMQNFWREITAHIADSKISRVDIFWPLASSENGEDILEDLSKLTGVKFSSPTGVAGSFTRMETEWFKEESKHRTVQEYFKLERVMTWVNCCNYLEEALVSLRKKFRDHVYDLHHGLTNNIIGELAGKLLQISSFVEVKGLCSAIRSSFEDDLQTLSEEDINVLLHVLSGKRCFLGILHYTAGNCQNRILEISLHGLDIPNHKKRLQELIEAILHTCDGNGNAKRPIDIKISDAPAPQQIEERADCAFFIYQTELEYNEKLKLFRNVYGKPVLSSIQAKRAIASNTSAKMIFSDCEVLQTISSDLVASLQKRIDSWNMEQCLGDVYLTYASNLKAYSNFLKNYPAILKTIERCSEENPSFRAFLDRQRQSLESEYLSIQELLILPTKINERRADMLSSLIKCTPSEHKDRQYIVKALKKLREMADNFRQVEERIEKERQFEELKIRIINCPTLSTEGRYFLKEMRLSELAARKEQLSNEEPLTHLHIQDVTIFLFNDILVCTKRFLRHQAFKRSLYEELRFDFAIDPRKIHVVDVQDSQHFHNAFTISFPEREWLLQARSKEDKLSNMSLLSEISSSALPDSYKLLKRK